MASFVLRDVVAIVKGKCAPQLTQKDTTCCWPLTSLSCLHFLCRMAASAAGYNNEINVVSPTTYPATCAGLPSPPTAGYIAGVAAHPEVVSATAVGRPLTPVTTLPGAAPSFPSQWPLSPCNTLFVANLGTYTTEQELREVFGRYVLLGK